MKKSKIHPNRVVEQKEGAKQQKSDFRKPLTDLVPPQQFSFLHRIEGDILEETKGLYQSLNHPDKLLQTLEDFVKLLHPSSAFRFKEQYLALIELIHSKKVNQLPLLVYRTYAVIKDRKRRFFKIFMRCYPWFEEQHAKESQWLGFFVKADVLERVDPEMGNSFDLVVQVPNVLINQHSCFYLQKQILKLVNELHRNRLNFKAQDLRIMRFINQGKKAPEIAEILFAKKQSYSKKNGKQSIRAAQNRVLEKARKEFPGFKAIKEVVEYYGKHHYFNY